MSTEPQVSLPLSDYQQLISKVNEKASHDLTVGRVYEITIEGHKENYQCKYKAYNTFHFTSGGIETKHIEITINENL